MPFHSSTSAPELPETCKAAVEVPFPPAYLTAAFKSPTSVQLEPFQLALLAFAGGVPPPKNNPAVDVPAPPASYLAVFTLEISVHDEPL